MKDLSDLYCLLGTLVEYPTAGLQERASRCRDLATNLRPEAVPPIEGFLASIQGRSQGSLEESYTAAFDLDPACCPYVGYQLVGEDPKRANLMLKLQEEYRTAGIDTGGELPDHLGMMLRFLGQQQDAELERELVESALLPALQKMETTLEESHPYGKLLRAVAAVLGPVAAGAGGHSGPNGGEGIPSAAPQG